MPRVNVTHSPSSPAAPTWHPLEIIPIFRRLPCSAWRDLLYTLVWNTLVAVLLTSVAFIYLREARFSILFFNTWVYSNVIGYLIHGAVVINGLILGSREPTWPPPLRFAWYALVAAPCVVLGYFVASWILRNPFGGMSDASDLRAMLVLALLISICLSAVSIVQTRVARADAVHRQQQLRRTEAERLATEARLRLLQAQIEPHFLFNTLANVTSLIDTDAPRAKRMLEDFTEFLRAILASIREPSTTLRRERDLLSAYLRVLEVRMGCRLKYEFAIGEDALDRAIPAMVLQPLVENAVKHGIDPAPGGGKITIGSERCGDELVLCVTDDGVGHAPNARMGVGLGSLEERLRAEYGARARLSVDHPQGGGTRVTVTLPVETGT